jgi:hypothetical protein
MTLFFTLVMAGLDRPSRVRARPTPIAQFVNAYAPKPMPVQLPGSPNDKFPNQINMLKRFKIVIADKLLLHHC